MSEKTPTYHTSHEHSPDRINGEVQDIDKVAPDQHHEDYESESPSTRGEHLTARRERITTAVFAETAKTGRIDLKNKLLHEAIESAFEGKQGGSKLLADSKKQKAEYTSDRSFVTRIGNAIRSVGEAA